MWISYPGNHFSARDAFLHLFQTACAEQLHALPGGFSAKFDHGSAPLDEVADRIRDANHFKDPHSTPVPGLAAFRTSSGAVDHFAEIKTAA